MSTYLLSPTENRLTDLFGNEAVVSNIPEQRGADIMMFTSPGSVGIQVKEIPNDFLSSVTDGRLARETSLLSSCDFRLLLLRGEFKFWPDGRVSLPGRREPGRFTKKQVQGILFDIKYVKGVDYDYVNDYEDIVYYVRHLEQWMNKETHLAMYNRPGGPKGAWIVPSASEVQSWLLQGFDGIGPAIADSIIKHFNGIPLAWACTFQELLGVPKLSPKRAQYLWNFLPKSGAHVELPASIVKAPISTSRLDDIRRMFARG